MKQTNKQANKQNKHCKRISCIININDYEVKNIFAMNQQTVFHLRVIKKFLLELTPVNLASLNKTRHFWKLYYFLKVF